MNDVEQDMWQMVRSAIPPDDETPCVISAIGEDFSLYRSPSYKSAAMERETLYGTSSLKTVNGFMPVRCGDTLWYVLADDVNVFALVTPAPYEGN